MMIPTERDEEERLETINSYRRTVNLETQEAENLLDDRKETKEEEKEEEKEERDTVYSENRFRESPFSKTKKSLLSLNKLVFQMTATSDLHSQTLTDRDTQRKNNDDENEEIDSLPTLANRFHRNASDSPQQIENLASRFKVFNTMNSMRRQDTTLSDSRLSSPTPLRQGSSSLIKY